MVATDWQCKERPSPFMQRALNVAALARGHCHPKPMVGYVIVKHGQIVGEGWHHQAGMAHAEVDALERAGTAAQGATVYWVHYTCRRFCMVDK